jgi:uncharacterized protein (DUF2252 family)
MNEQKVREIVRDELKATTGTMAGEVDVQKYYEERQNLINRQRTLGGEPVHQTDDATTKDVTNATVKIGANLIQPHQYFDKFELVKQIQNLFVSSGISFDEARKVISELTIDLEYAAINQTVKF